MVSKTLIGGTAYDISGGNTLVNGTSYSVKKGKTLIDETVYNIYFDDFFDLGTVTTSKTGMFNAGPFSGVTALPFEDMSRCNCLLINGELHEVDYSTNTLDSTIYHRYASKGFMGIPTENAPYMVQFTVTNDSVTALLMSYYEGAYDVSLGISNKFEIPKYATITITGYGGGDAKVTINGTTYSSPTTLTVRVGTTISCEVDTNYPDGNKYAYIYLNGSTVHKGEGTYGYTVVRDATITLFSGEEQTSGNYYEYGTITITET